MTRRDPLEALVLGAFRRTGIPPAGARIVVGLSGGPDSVCLLHVLWSISDTLPLRLEAAHLHHGLRGASADADEAFVREHCAALGVPLAVRRVDVGALAAATGRSVETCGRDERYAFLRETAGPGGFVAVAHHRGDQAETVLMNLCRGTGLDGLQGMRPVSSDLLRPLLGTPRTEILAYLDRHDLPYRTDPTNLEPGATRTRVRLEVLPRLDAAFDGDVSERIASAADLLAADAALLDRLAGDAFAAMRRRDGAVPCARLRDETRPLAARIVRRLYAEARGDRRDLPRKAVEAVLDLCATGRPGGPSGRISLSGGLEARAVRGWLRVGPAHPTVPTSTAPPVPTPPTPSDTPLRVPGVTEPGNGWRIRSSLIEKPGEMVYTSLEWCFRADMMDGCTIRSRREGDRIRPEGGSGSRSLKKLLIDRRIPREDRDALLVLAVGDKVLWVPGVAVDAEASARRSENSIEAGTGRRIRVALERFPVRTNAGEGGTGQDGEA
jgi:tRNA(Ile)-lysidine synthase